MSTGVKLLRIRPAVAADIPAMISLERSTASAAHWSPEQYQALFSGPLPLRVALVAEQVREVQGFLVGRSVADEWEIENIVVASSLRRQGVGTGLLNELLRMARQRGAMAVFLEVRASNDPARMLYERVGFVKSGRRRAYYHQPDEDAIVYRQAIHSS